MSETREAAVPAVSRLSGSDRKLAWALLLLMTALHWIIAGEHGASPLQGEFVDTDAYSWMVRATDLMQSGDWFDATLDRVDPPQGLQQHWTRPLDALIVGGALPLGLFVDADRALFLTGMLVSPLLHLIGLGILMWGAGPLLGRGRAPLMGVLYLAQMAIFGYSMAGRPDHHSLILLLTNLAVVLSLRLAYGPRSSRLALALGAVFALALWSGVESLVTVFGCMAGFGFLWLGRGRESRLAEDLRWTGLSALLVGIAALWLQRGGAAFRPLLVVDSYSAFHVFLLGLIGCFWSAVHWTERRHEVAATLRGRIGLASGLILASAAALVACFPAVLDFAPVQMDPFYRQTRFANITEYQPLLSVAAIRADGLGAALGEMLIMVGILFPAIGFLIWVLFAERRSAERPIWVLSASVTVVMLCVYGAQDGLEFRDAPYLQLIALVPYSELCYRLISHVGQMCSGLTLAVLRPFLLVLALDWYAVPKIAVAAAETGSASPAEEIACKISDVAPTLRERDDPARLEIVMAWVDFGPELMYRTPHAVLSIPNHHAQAGYRLTWDAMTAADADTARRLIMDRAVDYVVLCNNRKINDFYAQLGARQTFREQLLAGETPDWLLPQPLPQAHEGLYLYRVRR